jgi:hypothetical protein
MTIKKQDPMTMTDDAVRCGGGGTGILFSAPAGSFLDTSQISTSSSSVVCSDLLPDIAQVGGMIEFFSILIRSTIIITSFF